jgi:hypothetical protein
MRRSGSLRGGMRARSQQVVGPPSSPMQMVWEAKTLASTRLAKEVTNVDVDTYYVSGSRGMSGGVGTTTSFLDFAREAELPQMYRSDQTVCGQCERRKPP